MRKGLSAVYGFIVIYLLIMAGLGAFSNVSSSQFSLQRAVDRARQADSLRSSEHLTLAMRNHSLFVTNDGPVLSALSYMVEQTRAGTTLSRLGSQLSPGANLTLGLIAGATRAGIVTASGNLFWDQVSSLLQLCSNGTSTVTSQVFPQDSGTVSPPGLTYLCGGQDVRLLATPNAGYVFSRWSGSGIGSYSGSANPAVVTGRGLESETAFFMPAVSVSLSYSEDGIASGGPARSVEVTAVGAPQKLNFSAGPLPQGVSVSFNPPSVINSLTGATTMMTISFSGNAYGSYPLTILATGADNQTGSATYKVQLTPPNGNYLLVGYPLYLNGIGNPREHKAAYWKGTYFLSFTDFKDHQLTDDYVPVYYSAGWTSGTVTIMALAPYPGYDFDLYQSSNVILRASVSDNGANFCYDLGYSGAGSIQWQFSGAACAGQQTPTRYTAESYASGLIDSSGNWWGAVETQSLSGAHYFEVLTATNGAWEDVYVSPSFGSESFPVPQVLQLQDGTIVILYTTFGVESHCVGDYVIYTKDGGYSWSSPEGPFLAGGKPLCYDGSSATTIGNRVYAGGLNSVGAVAFWSYDFDNATTTSSILAASANYAATSSVGGTLVVAYTTPNTCGGGNSLHLTWSHDGGSTWNDSGNVDCVHDYVILPSGASSFQIAILSDFSVAGQLVPKFVFYTV